MNFKHLRSFVHVARSGSFSQAAEELHTVQSAISRHIRALEQELDVRLLERNTRNVELTAPGEAFLEHAQAILHHCQHASTHARMVANGKKGVLRIGYMSSACGHFLPGLLRSFRSQNPDVQVEILEMTAAQQLTGFAQGRIDVGFSRALNSQQALIINSQHLLDDPVVVAMADNHPLADAGSLSLEDLASYSLTLFAREQAPSLFDTLISAEPGHMQALLTQVASNDSVALVPGCVRNLQTHGCTFAELAEPLSIALEMHWPQQHSSTTKTWLDWFAGSGITGRFRQQAPANGPG